MGILSVVNGAWKTTAKVAAAPFKAGFNGSKALLMNENALIKWGSRGAAAAAAVAVGKSMLGKSNERVEQVPPEMIAQQNQLSANQQVLDTMEQNAQAQAVVDAPIIATAEHIQQEAQAQQVPVQQELAQKDAPQQDAANQPNYQVAESQHHGAVSQGQSMAINA